MPTAETRAALVLERCDALAACSEEPERLTRRFATPALRAAGELVAGWMRSAGLSVERDAIGNVIGRREGAGGPPLVLGSHLDTVRDAGRYDGMLGVLVALACVQAAGPGPLEVIAFADEEGVRFGTAYLGSAAVAGRFEPDWLARRDSEGVAMADALREFGGDPEAVESARRDVAGYVEVHIEQGPVLEERGLPVGVVSGIAGQTRARIVFTGAAGHAGTVPMELRRDALVAAAEWIVAVEAGAVDGLVATVGEVAVAPGASNVIPGRVDVSLDVRHPEDGVREAASSVLRDRAVAVGSARGVEVGWSSVQSSPSVVCDPSLTASLAASVGAAGYPELRLVSGAGHDAAMMASVAPVAMLFVRCAAGVSHDPAERVDVADVAVAIEVMDRFVSGVLDSCRVTTPGQDRA
jgi:allantoate deiminase